MNLPEIFVFALMGLLWGLIVMGVTYHYRRTLPGDQAMCAARVVASAFGTGAGLLGLEHGYFEMLQGNVVPNGIVISAIGPPCQPEAAWHGCEPALTLIPNFLFTGITAMAVATVILIWAAVFMQWKYDGIALLLLSVVLFLVGGGFTTLWLGLLGGIAGTRIGVPPRKWGTQPSRLSQIIARLWPWLLIAYLVWWEAAWIIAARSPDLMQRLTPLVTILTPVVLVLILASALAHDRQEWESHAEM